MQEIHAGRVVGTKYELVRLLGRGSMGEVWLAHHQSLNESVAIKLLSRPPAGGGFEYYAMCAARFRFEAQVAARLSRKTRHIVRVTDHGEEGDGLAYLVMELLEGQTLEQRLAVGGAMTALEVAKIVAQIARALEEAHAESIVHRDLKPANVFLTLDEDAACVVKLLDFGIARAMRTQRVVAKFATGDGLVFGTPGYMSPEQARGSKIDSRCDLWALATVAYEALSGDLPVSGGCTEELLKNLYDCHVVKIHTRRPQLPLGLQAFFERALAPRVEDRFVSASQLSLAFQRAIGGDERPVPLAQNALVPGFRSDPPGVERPVPERPLRVAGSDGGAARTLVAARMAKGRPRAARLGGMAFALVLSAFGVGMVAARASHVGSPSTEAVIAQPPGPSAARKEPATHLSEGLAPQPTTAAATTGEATMAEATNAAAATAATAAKAATAATTPPAAATAATATAAATAPAATPPATSPAGEASRAGMSSSTTPAAPTGPAPRPAPPRPVDRSAIL